MDECMNGGRGKGVKGGEIYHKRVGFVRKKREKVTSILKKTGNNLSGKLQPVSSDVFILTAASFKKVKTSSKSSLCRPLTSSFNNPKAS